MRLTDQTIRSLTAPPQGQKLYRDDTLPGFGCRVSQGGTRTFVLVHGEERQFLTIGRYPIISLSDARTEAKRFLAERTLGKLRPQSLNFPRAVEMFLEEKRKSKRASTIHDYEYYLDKFFNFKGPVAEISHPDILKRLDRIKSPSMYNHALAAARGFFNWCQRRRYITDNPVTGLSPHRTVSRARVLEDTELKLIYRASDSVELPAPFRSIVKLLILTGQRRGEIAALRGGYISSTECTITLPSELTKNHQEHTFPTGALSVEILGRHTTKKDGGYIFPARGKFTPFNGWSKAKAALDKLSGVTDWTLHDLRRTFATRLSEMGTPIHVVEKLLNHTSGVTGGLVGIYQRNQYWDEQVAAVTAWNQRLQQLLKD
ncbi:MAG: tyrosine-type recombinase/integrase [Pseudolabrys sp.]